MEDFYLTAHLQKVFSELAHRIAQKVIDVLKQSLPTTSLSPNEKLLKDTEICEQLQITTSHFYQLKKKHPNFPTYNLEGAKRYKQSEVEQFFKTLKKS